MRTGFTNRPGIEYDPDKLNIVFAEDMQAIHDELLTFLTLSEYASDIVDYERLDGTNQPSTGNKNVEKMDPEMRITDTGDSEYARWTRTVINKQVSHKARVSNAESIALGTDLAIHYLLNDNAETTTVLNNVSGGNASTGGDNTADMTVSGKINTALHLDGTADTIIDSGINVTPQSFTCSFWWKRTANSNAFHIIGTGVNSGVQKGFLFYDYTVYGGTVGMYIANSSGWFGGGLNGLATTLDEWTLIQATYDGTTGILNLYQNNSFMGSKDMSANKTVSYDTGTLKINWPDNYPAVGDIDDFRLYNRVLTTAELNAIDNGGDGTESQENIYVTTEQTYLSCKNGVSDNESSCTTLGESGGRTVVTSNILYLADIPTSNPNKAGRVWSDGGVIKISAG